MLAAYAAKTGGDAPLDNLTVGERAIPEPGRGEVRVRLRAVTLNHHDYFTLRGIVGYPITLPRTLGCDGAGIVDAYGPERRRDTPEPGSEVVIYPVTRCGVCVACMGGDPMLCRTFTMLSDGDVEGSLAEFVVVPASNVVAKPAGMTFAQAACMGVTFLTAYRMLFVKAALAPGRSVLVHGAGGGLSSAAIALARAAGLMVIACTRSEDSFGAARALGAHHAVLLNKEAAKRVAALTGGLGVDAVIESVGEPTWATSLRAVRQGGSVVVCGATAGPNPPADLSRIFWRQISVLGSTMGTLPEFLRLLQFVERAGIEPRIDSTYELADARRAFERLAGGGMIGKIAIEMKSPSEI